LTILAAAGAAILVQESMLVFKSKFIFSQMLYLSLFHDHLIICVICESPDVLILEANLTLLHFCY